MKPSKYVPRSRGMSSPVRVVAVTDKGHKKPLVDVEVGKVYKSVADAAMFTGICKQSILTHLNGTMTHARGVVFERVEENRVIKCEVCEKVVEKKSDRHRFCSARCANVFHDALRGERRRIKREKEKQG